MMADSLADIDPNTANGDEGKALLRKMYKLRKVNHVDSTPIMPETPNRCINEVAGKIIQIESLTDDLDEATSFQDFFANVYCSAYINSLVTMHEGFSQIYPGGLDFDIEKGLKNVYGDFPETEIDTIEWTALMTFFDAIDSGDYVVDESILIDEVEPLEAALNICKGPVKEEVLQAKQDREDYLNDYNFEKFLRTL